MNNHSTIIQQFSVIGNVKDASPFGNGLINDTYYVETEDDSTPNYLLQRVNHNVFQDVELLQNNIEAVTSHIRHKLEERKEEDIERKVLKFISTLDGKKYYFDGNSYWRMMIHIPRSKSYEAVNPEYSYYAGKAFGDFQLMLADIPTELGETIPNFHNMEFRLKQFNDAIAENKANRLADVQDIVNEINSRITEMCKAEQMYREGKLPKRVCHCDTKVNNILFDENNNILCVIDLDTVMPSFVFSDFGDFLRTAANTGEEDDKNLDNVNFNMEIFKAFTKGYLESAKPFLTQIEIDNLPYAAKLFPYMQCVRFFTDYINGDTYYKIKYPEHNLIRTYAQLKLLKSVEASEQQMVDYIKSCC